MSNLIIIEHQKKRVLTTQQLADIYETDIKNISNNFNRNQDRFTENKDYYLLEGDKLKTFKGIHLNDESLKFVSKLYLWTERGANRHSKILDTDRAWQQFDMLEETYFQVKSNILVSSYMIEDPIKRAEQWIKEQKEKEILQLENAQSKQIINELKPKADYTDLILKNKGLVTITQISKDYGMSGQEMNKTLHDLKVQYKQNKQWLLYSNIQKNGYTHSETIVFKHSDGRADVNMITKWTQKGRLFLYDLLKSKNGILPLIEREESEAI